MANTTYRGYLSQKLDRLPESGPESGLWGLPLQELKFKSLSLNSANA